MPNGQHLWSEQDDGTQAVAPGELILILVNAVKQLAAEVAGLKANRETQAMGCGCGERRQIGGEMVSALRRGDTAALKQHMGEMASSLGQRYQRPARQPELAAGTEADPRAASLPCAQVLMASALVLGVDTSRLFTVSNAIQVSRSDIDRALPIEVNNSGHRCSTTSSARSRATSPRCRHRSSPPPSPVGGEQHAAALRHHLGRQHGHLRRRGSRSATRRCARSAVRATASSTGSST